MRSATARCAMPTWWLGSGLRVGVGVGVGVGIGVQGGIGVEVGCAGEGDLDPRHALISLLDLSQLEVAQLGADLLLGIGSVLRAQCSG